MMGAGMGDGCDWCQMLNDEMEWGQSGVRWEMGEGMGDGDQYGWTMQMYGVNDGVMSGDATMYVRWCGSVDYPDDAMVRWWGGVGYGDNDGEWVYDGRGGCQAGGGYVNGV